MFQSEHHGLPEHDISPSGQAWSYAGSSNMHWRPFHKSWSWYHNNAIHHSKPSIISSKYQMYIQCPFVRSPNSLSNIPQELNSPSEGSRCLRLNTHLDPDQLCHLQCNISTVHSYSTHSNIMNVRIVHNDLLVISCTKLRNVYGLNPAIEIGNTLKRKTGIPAHTLGAIMITSCTWWPFDMNHIHRSTTAWQACHLVVIGNPAQLRYACRHRNVLLAHLMHRMEESVKEWANFWDWNVRHRPTGLKWRSCPQAVESSHDKYLWPLMELLSSQQWPCMFKVPAVYEHFCEFF